MRKAPENPHRLPPENPHRESVKYADAPVPVETAVSVDEGNWLHYGGGWYENLETGETRKGRP